MALLVLSALCFLLNLASLALGDPQPSQAQVQTQPLPNAPDSGQIIQTTGSAPAYMSPVEQPKPDFGLAPTSSNTIQPYVPAVQTKPAPKPVKPTAEPVIETKVADLKKTDPGLISKIISATKGLIGRAVNWLGTQYIWGGISKNGVDCSGLTRLLYLTEGITLPHSAKLQYKIGQAVARMALLPGDLVFFNTTGPISHVGMYIGNGEFLHAANPRRGVRVDNLNSGYYSKHFAGARRYKTFG